MPGDAHDRALSDPTVVQNCLRREIVALGGNIDSSAQIEQGPQLKGHYPLGPELRATVHFCDHKFQGTALIGLSSAAETQDLRVKGLDMLPNR